MGPTAEKKALSNDSKAALLQLLLHVWMSWTSHGMIFLSSLKDSKGYKIT